MSKMLKIFQLFPAIEWGQFQNIIFCHILQKSTKNEQIEVWMELKSLL